MIGGVGAPLALRGAEQAEHPVLASIWREAWVSANPGAAQVEPARHWSDRAVREFGPPNHTVLAIAGGEIVALYVVSPADRYLHQRQVRPAVQRRGVGATILRRIKASCWRGFTPAPGGRQSARPALR